VKRERSDLKHARSHPKRAGSGVKRAGSRVTRRGIQITLGLLWILDGALQFQPAMLTSKFASQVIAPAGDGQPAFVGWPVHQAAALIGRQPAWLDVAFGLIQLALGAGLLHRRTVRWALAASLAWALSVWYLGEGLGGLFGGGASLLTGAPGSALLYAVVAMAAWPQPGGSPGDQRPARRAAAAWAVLWLGGAFLQLLPGNDTNASLSMALTMNASGAPGWLAAVGHQLSALVPDTGVSLIVDLVVLQALAGLGVLMGGRRTRRAAVIGGVALSLVFWVAGQGAGQFWTGISTDPNTAPLVMLLGVAVLGAAPWRQPDRRQGPGNSGSGRRALVSMTAKAEAGMVTVS
jgi:hypothetical protein